MNRYFLLPFLLLCSSLISFAQVKVANLRVENLVNPVGLDITQPRFSWQLVSEKRNVLQTAYELRVANDATALGKAPDLIWQTGKVNSDQSLYVPYGGAALQSGKRYYWQVRVWDKEGKASAWSAPAYWQMALLQPSDWKAKWIEPGYAEDSVLRPSPLMRKEFSAPKKIRSATAYITAHGLYEAFINGKRVGDAYLTPGWTVYPKRLQYQTYDVTNLLKNGANAVGVQLGSGWYRGVIGFENNRNVYGKDIALLFQLNIEYGDGTTESIVSDETWKSATGAIQSSEIYNGEFVDARLHKEGWNNTGFNDAGWAGVAVRAYPMNNLLATYNEPIRKKETFRPVKMITTPKGEQVIDFGQNLVGWLVIKASGKAGDKLVVQHAEVLDKQGNFYTENLRAAKATDTYILTGKGEETFEPRFTFHGFRYAKIEGYPGTLKPENIEAVALYSDMKQTGSFTSSHPLINQLQHNIEWGQKGNFLDVPTDCPQRDERLGWTGDAQVFSRTAAFNMDVHNFFSKWLKDVAANQLPNGSVHFVVPNVINGNAAGATGWADAATIIPWNMYLAYGDKKILEEQYESMKSWVGYMQNQSKNDLWNTGFHFGDWLSYMQDNDLMGRSAITDKYFLAQCFYAHSTQLLINAARILGRNDEAATYEALLKRIKDAFLKEYVTANGRMVSSTQTAYVIALNFDMLPEPMRPEAVNRLVENIKSYNNHLTTGFLGTPYLCHVLSRFGRADVAYQLLMQESFPSWLYPVKMGATTIWERWNGIRPDSTFEPASMNSFNHYAYGAIGDWMYRVVAGLDTDVEKPGYRHSIIKPHIGGGLTSAAAELQTSYGKLKSAWKLDGGQLTLDVEVPPNTTATLYIPAKDAADVMESGKPLSSLKDHQVVQAEKGYAGIMIGSGKYNFSVKQ